MRCHFDGSAGTASNVISKAILERCLLQSFDGSRAVVPPKILPSHNQISPESQLELHCNTEVILLNDFSDNLIYLLL